MDKKPAVVIKISALEKMAGPKETPETEDDYSSKVLAMHPVAKMSDEELKAVHSAACAELEKRDMHGEDYEHESEEE
jgi:hypothetical protein